MECKIIKRERWSISLLMTFTQKNWELVPIKQIHERKPNEFLPVLKLVPHVTCCVLSTIYSFFFYSNSYNSFLIMYIPSRSFQWCLNRLNPMPYEKVRLIWNLGEIVKLSCVSVTCQHDADVKDEVDKLYGMMLMNFDTK